MTHTKMLRRGVAACLALGLGLGLAACGSEEPTQEDATSAASAQSGGATQMAGASASVDGIELIDMWARESSLDLSAAFGTVKNTSDQQDTLIAVTVADVPRVELHEAVDGAMQEKDGGFDVPAGGDLVLQPGGNHIMLMGLTDKIEPGSTMSATLSFASGVEVDVEMPVRPFTGGNMDGTMDMDSGGMDSGDMGSGDMDSDESQNDG